MQIWQMVSSKLTFLKMIMLVFVGFMCSLMLLKYFTTVLVYVQTLKKHVIHIMSSINDGSVYDIGISQFELHC